MQPPDFSARIEIAGRQVTLRPIGPGDREIEDAFVRELSPTSRYLRFHSGLRQLTPAMLERFTHPNYPDDMALIATIDSSAGVRQIGVARYIRNAESDAAEVAVAVADDWQGRGVGRALLLALRDIARDAGIRRFEMVVLPENRRMLELARSLGFRVLPRSDDPRSIELGKETEPPRDPSRGPAES